MEDFAQGIRLDGHGSSNPDQDHLSRLLRSAHTVELIRDGMALSDQIPGYIPEITPAVIKKIYANEDSYLKVTGDQRQAGGGYTSDFYKLSTQPGLLLQAVQSARKTNAQ